MQNHSRWLYKWRIVCWFLLCLSRHLFSLPLFLCLQAQTDLASLAFIPLAFLDTALCWWISFSLACLMADHFLPLEMGFHWSFCKGFLSVDYSLARGIGRVAVSSLFIFNFKNCIRSWWVWAPFLFLFFNEHFYLIWELFMYLTKC